MKRLMIKRPGWKRCLFVVVLMISWVWTMTATAIEINMSGGEALDLSRFQVVHKETFDTGKGQEAAFWGALDVGQKANDPWTGMLAKDLYSLTHAGRPGSVRYYFRHRLDPAVGATLSQSPVSVDIGGTMNDDLSGAGLIYALDPQTKNYLAFVKGAGRSYAIYKRGADGLRQITSGTSNAVRPNQANQLAIVPRQSGIDFYINGNHIAGIKDANVTSGGAGLLAISSGMFLFDNFTLYNSSEGGNAPAIPAPDVQSAPAPTPKPVSPSAEIDKPAPAPTAHQTSPARNTVAKQASANSKNKNLKVGMPKQQVIQLLGEPAYMRGSRFFYDNKAGGNGQKEGTLVIQFDDNGKLQSHKTIE